jgi:hypothetical protein
MVATVSLALAFDFEGVDVNDIVFKVKTENIDETVTFTPTETAFMSVMIVLTEFCFFLSWRTFSRKRYDVKDQTYYYIFNWRFDTYYISFVTLYLIVIAWCVTVYWNYKNVPLLVAGLIVPGIVLCMGNGYLFLVKNDFDFFQNIGKLNRKIAKNNK